MKRFIVEQIVQAILKKRFELKKVHNSKIFELFKK
jgi:hypothetical protein